MTVYEFGNKLLDTNDLDPIYVALVKAREASWSQDYLHRWLIAYWCFYNAGVACYLARKSFTLFWLDALMVARNHTPSPLGGRWPRGRERRHFRGRLAVETLSCLAERYPEPNEFIEQLFRPTYQAAEDVMRRVRAEYGFGPWIAFKIADMGETVLGYPIEFDLDTAMYAESKAGAEIVQKELGLNSLEETVNHLQAYWYDRKAPPRYERKLGLQELETIFCKYKAYLNGRYPVGLDTREIREGVEPWIAVCPEAKTFMEGLPDDRVG